MVNELRVWRAKRRVNQRQAAAAAGIGYDRYMRIENGYTEPSDDEQRQLASGLDCRVRDIFPRPRVKTTASAPAA